MAKEEKKAAMADIIKGRVQIEEGCRCPATAQHVPVLGAILSRGGGFPCAVGGIHEPGQGVLRAMISPKGMLAVVYLARRVGPEARVHDPFGLLGDH